MSKYFPLFEHEGKKYILASRWNILLISFLLAILIFFGLILKTTIENIDEIKTNPLSYGAKLYGIEYCSCRVDTQEEIVFTPYSAERKINLNKDLFNVSRINLSKIGN